MLKEEEKFGIKKNLKLTKKFGEKVYRIRENVRKNIKKLKNESKIILGYGAKIRQKQLQH